MEARYTAHSLTPRQAGPHCPGRPVQVEGVGPGSRSRGLRCACQPAASPAASAAPVGGGGRLTTVGARLTQRSRAGRRVLTLPDAPTAGPAWSAELLRQDSDSSLHQRQIDGTPILEDNIAVEDFGGRSPASGCAE